jgi:hypothetical protein
LRGKSPGSVKNGCGAEKCAPEFDDDRCQICASDSPLLAGACEWNRCRTCCGLLVSRNRTGFWFE